MRNETAASYHDFSEHLSECFELIRIRADAYALRSEAMDSERLVRYSERTGYLTSERSQFLEIYRDLEHQASLKEEEIRAKKREAESRGVRFPVDRFAATHGLTEEELWVSLFLLWNESQGASQARYQSGNEILNVLFPKQVDALKASRVFHPTGSLLAKGLIRLAKDSESANFLRATYELCEGAVLELLQGVSKAGLAGRESPAGSVEDGPENDLSFTTKQVPEGPFRVVCPRFRLDRVALTPSVRRLLREAVEEARARSLLWEQWGLEEVLEKGKAVVLLFAGPPGTGKSMAAEGLAGELGASLLVADYAELESKWIGDTEKNIVSAFRAAREARAVLLFDEADSVIAHRLSGDHYNDRAYNRQVALFLSEIERHEGVVILTSNRTETLDKGLIRRIGVRVAFPRPGEEERFLIWKSLMPPRAPLAADVDIRVLAERFPMSGGEIKIAVLGALRRAARRREENPEATITLQDFITAAEEASADPTEVARKIGFLN